nr:hypothetical protein [Tanacetum cinerariifolium]
MVVTMKPKSIQKRVQISSALTDEAVMNGSIKKVEKRGNVGNLARIGVVGMIIRGLGLEMFLLLLQTLVMTRSAGRPIAESQRGGTGVRVGRGGKGRRPREEGVNGNVEGINGGVGGALDFSTIIAHQLQNLLPAMLAQVGNQGNVGNQNAILSGADNHPPMLEKDMYDSWKSIMELYMMNRQHGRMILESVGNGPLIWPSSKENRVTRLKKYSELSDMDAIQAECDERECKLYDEFDKFAYKKGETLNVKLVRDLHTMNVDQLYAYLEQHEFYANKSPQYAHTHSSTPLSINYPLNDFQSSVHHNVYTLSSSIPQVEYASSVNQQLDFFQPDSGLIFLVFQKCGDPIDAINHMMSFLTVVVTSWYPPANNHLNNPSDPDIC